MASTRGQQRPTARAKSKLDFLGLNDYHLLPFSKSYSAHLMTHDPALRGNFLGIDFGTKRIGLAVGQSITKTATPLLSLHAQKGISWDQLARLVSEWEIRGFVVGLALQENNSHSTISKAAQKFGYQINTYFKLPVFFINERLTSVMAQERLKESLSGKGDLDAIAAAIILESWFRGDPREVVDYVPGQQSI